MIDSAPPPVLVFPVVCAISRKSEQRIVTAVSLQCRYFDDLGPPLSLYKYPPILYIQGYPLLYTPDYTFPAPGEISAKGDCNLKTVTFDHRNFKLRVPTPELHANLGVCTFLGPLNMDFWSTAKWRWGPKRSPRRAGVTASNGRTVTT